MQAQQSTTETVMKSPSLVLIPREDPLPTTIFGVIALTLGLIFIVALMTLLSALMPKSRSRELVSRNRLVSGHAGYSSRIYGRPSPRMADCPPRKEKDLNEVSLAMRLAPISWIFVLETRFTLRR
jgi:hypothetical protein